MQQAAESRVALLVLMLTNVYTMLLPAGSSPARTAPGAAARAGELSTMFTSLHGGGCPQNVFDTLARRPTQHACTQANGMGEGGLGGFQMGAGGGRQRQKPTSDFWWDVAGWVTLITAVSTLGMLASRANLPGPPTAPPMPK